MLMDDTVILATSRESEAWYLEGLLRRVWDADQREEDRIHGREWFNS